MASEPISCFTQIQLQRASSSHMGRWSSRLRSGRKETPQDIQTQTTKDPLSRKRRPEVPEDEPSAKRRQTASLTKANLQKLDLEMAERRSHSKRASGSRKHSSSKKYNTDEPSSESTTKALSTTAPGFPDRAFDNGILKPTYSRPPDNIDELRDCANRMRETASPSESEYRDYVECLADIDGEDSTIHATAHLLKTYGRGVEYRQMYNQPFSAFPRDIGFNTSLAPAQPDYVQGLRRQAFDPFPVREVIDSAVYRPGVGAITLSHFSGEFKAPGKDTIQGETQASYNGAHLVYARDSANTLLNTPDPPHYAVVTGFVTDGSVLRTYAHHAERSSDQVKYHQTRIESADISNSYEDYKKGRRQLRNLQDHAKEASYALRDRLLALDDDHDVQPANQPLNDYTANVSTPATGNDTEYAMLPSDHFPQAPVCQDSGTSFAQREVLGHSKAYEVGTSFYPEEDVGDDNTYPATPPKSAVRQLSPQPEVTQKRRRHKKRY